MEARSWYFHVRAQAGQRMASRILQVLATQLMEPDDLRSRLAYGSLSVAFTLITEEKCAHRVGLLLRRLPGVQSAIWLLSPLETTMSSNELALSLFSSEESGPETDPAATFWSEAPAVFFQSNQFGEPIPGHDTEVRARWTEQNFYFLFRSRYEDRSSLPCPAAVYTPTDELWLGDVAEIFLGESTDPFTRYAEFEVSPRSEWLDLLIEHRPGADIHREPLASRFVCAARIDTDAKTWYAFFRIPRASVCASALGPGDRFRINLFRSQGSPPVELCWRPTLDPSFHVPSAFGTLVLA